MLPVTLTGPGRRHEARPQLGDPTGSCLQSHLSRFPSFLLLPVMCNWSPEKPLVDGLQ